ISLQHRKAEEAASGEPAGARANAPSAGGGGQPRRRRCQAEQQPACLRRRARGRARSGRPERWPVPRRVKAVGWGQMDRRPEV
ncbi:unnamed protein product, partial [Urochloa humidicola]